MAKKVTKVQLLSLAMKAAYEYVFYGAHDPNLSGELLRIAVEELKTNKIRVLGQIVESFPDLPEISAVQHILKTVETTDKPPTPDFCIQQLDFPHHIIPSPIAHEYSSVWAGLMKETEVRRTQAMSSRLAQLSSDLAGGKSDIAEIRSELDDIASSLSSQSSEAEELSIASILDDRKKTIVGPDTGIGVLDAEIKGIEPGTVFTFLGFVGSFKTTFAVNLLHRSICDGLNGVFITFEVDKKVLYAHLLSRHSLERQFRRDASFPKDSIQKCTLTPDQEKYLIDVIEPDLRGPGKGSFQLLDRADFPAFDKAGIRNRLRALPFKPDYIIFDYIQLTKFYGDPILAKLRVNPINAFVRIFAEIGLDFDGTGHKAAIILLSQANREGWKAAVDAGGEYSLTALADANELERTSYYVVSSFVDPNLQQSDQAKFQLLKHRGGKIIQEPFLVSVLPAYAAMGEEATARRHGFDQSIDGFSDDLDSLLNTI